MTKIKMLQDERTTDGLLNMGQVVEVSPSLANDLVGLGVAEFEKEPEPQIYRQAFYGDYLTLTVPELKEILKARGLPVGGTKSDLIKRLRENE